MAGVWGWADAWRVDLSGLAGFHKAIQSIVKNITPEQGRGVMVEMGDGSLIEEEHARRHIEK